ncbi:hypothetical protein SK128_019031 [Halocaridina rubra]|uniref:Uncharacterized protein n=1 Tax=Halocaridina rubra TaxID=373956 RepID=A0AAN8WU40_HALRR
MEMSVNNRDCQVSAPISDVKIKEELEEEEEMELEVEVKGVIKVEKPDLCQVSSSSDTQSNSKKEKKVWLAVNATEMRYRQHLHDGQGKSSYLDNLYIKKKRGINCEKK